MQNRRYTYPILRKTEKGIPGISNQLAFSHMVIWRKMIIKCAKLNNEQENCLLLTSSPTSTNA